MGSCYFLLSLSAQQSTAWLVSAVSCYPEHPALFCHRRLPAALTVGVLQCLALRAGAQHNSAEGGRNGFDAFFAVPFRDPSCLFIIVPGMVLCIQSATEFVVHGIGLDQITCQPSQPQDYEPDYMLLCSHSVWDSAGTRYRFFLRELTGLCREGGEIRDGIQGQLSQISLCPVIPE